MDSATTIALVVAVLAGSTLALELVARMILTAGRLRAPHLPGVRGLVIAATILAALGRTTAHAATPPPALRLERPVQPSVASVPEQEAAADPVDTRYQVQPGDSLWGIAARMLREDPSDAPPSAEVDRLWRTIYEANRDVVGPNPDLIYPGQRLVVPVEA